MKSIAFLMRNDKKKMLREKKLSVSFLLLVFLLITSCSCHVDRRVVKIGIDPSWFPLEVTAVDTNIYGYVEELLLEISKQSDYEFEKINANWDDTLENVAKNKFDLTITSIGEYNFFQDRFDSSANFLSTGLVLVYPSTLKKLSKEELNGKIIGVLSDRDSIVLLKKYPNAIVKKYYSIPVALNAIINQEIHAALIDELISYLYLKNIYYDKLKMTEPLSQKGLRFIAKKDKEKYLLNRIDRIINKMKKNGRLAELEKKWDLR